MYEKIYDFVQSVDDVAWGWGMILLLLGTHVFLTIRTGFIQRKRRLQKESRCLCRKRRVQTVRSASSERLPQVIASTIGTGNIIGVGTAIALGGPGAVLWCWLTGVLPGLPRSMRSR